MLRSMTGFGSARGGADGVDYTVEVRSVNNRYLKCNVRLPESWARAETEIEKIIRSHVTRGTVMLNVWMKVPSEQVAGEINTVVLKQYVDQLRLVDAGEGSRLDIASLVLLPGVCQAPPMDDLCSGTKDCLMQLIGEALEAMGSMRIEEGKVIEADMRNNCNEIETWLAGVAGRTGQVVKDYRDRLAARVEELIGDGRAVIAEETLAREVAVFAERSDIAEEVSRLTGHVEHFRKQMDSRNAGGRKLEFIAQEMLREANTVGSKASDLEITRAVVEIKTAIDRIKEQVQNVE